MSGTLSLIRPTRTDEPVQTWSPSAGLGFVAVSQSKTLLIARWNLGRVQGHLPVMEPGTYSRLPPPSSAMSPGVGIWRRKMATRHIKMVISVYSTFTLVYGGGVPRFITSGYAGGAHGFAPTFRLGQIAGLSSGNDGLYAVVGEDPRLQITCPLR